MTKATYLNVFIFHFLAKKDISGNEKKSQKFQDIFIDFFFVRSILKSVLIEPQDENIKIDLPPVRLELTAFRL